MLVACHVSIHCCTSRLSAKSLAIAVYKAKASLASLAKPSCNCSAAHGTHNEVSSLSISLRLDLLCYRLCFLFPSALRALSTSQELIQWTRLRLGDPQDMPISLARTQGCSQWKHSGPLSSKMAVCLRLCLEYCHVPCSEKATLRSSMG